MIRVERYEQTFSQEAEPPEIRGTTAERWKVLDGDKPIAFGYPTRELAEEQARHIEQSRRPVDVKLEDGRIITMRWGTAQVFQGLDADGHLVVESPDLPGYPYALTDCCHATGKGSMNSRTGVCCRSCYREVDVYFGGQAGPVVTRPA